MHFILDLISYFYLFPFNPNILDLGFIVLGKKKKRLLFTQKVLEQHTSEHLVWLAAAHTFQGFTSIFSKGKEHKQNAALRGTFTINGNYKWKSTTWMYQGRNSAESRVHSRWFNKQTWAAGRSQSWGVGWEAGFREQMKDSQEPRGWPTLCSPLDSLGRKRQRKESVSLGKKFTQWEVFSWKDPPAAQDMDPEQGKKE